MCATLGIAKFDAMLDSRRLPTRPMLVALVDALEKAPVPMIIKCSGGQDRASLAAAIFVLLRSGWAAQTQSEEQFARFPYLHFPKRTQRWLEQFPRYAALRARGKDVGRFIRDEYDPEDFAAWLVQNGMADRFSGIFSLPWQPHRPWFKFW